MQTCHPETFELYIDDGGLLATEDLAVELLSESFGITGWNPFVPSPPPLYQARNSGAFIPRSPARLDRSQGGQPNKQDPRSTRATETVAVVLNGLIRNGDIIRIGTQDFRLSWIPPEYETADAPVGAMFYDPTLEKLAYKRTDGVTQYFQFE